MIKSFIVDSACNNMRLDRWLRNKLGNLPQSLIEKSLRSGKIKVNKKKIKSSFKVKADDKVDLFNFEFKIKINQKKIKFNPTNTIIKANENFIAGFPGTKFREEALYTKFLSLYQIGINSIFSKKEERLKELQKQYDLILRYYPETPFLEDLNKKMDNVNDELQKFITTSTTL